MGFMSTYVHLLVVMCQAELSLASMGCLGMWRATPEGKLGVDEMSNGLDQPKKIGMSFNDCPMLILTANNFL
jgi:hypothetical protein